jgi:hypothetical protein
MPQRDILTSRAPDSISRYFQLVIWLVVAFFLLVTLKNMVEIVPAEKIMVVQGLFSGKLVWFTTPGPKYQGCGKVTKYSRRDIYEFEIPVRFNDGGHGTIQGSVQYELPLDAEHLNQIQLKFGSQRAVESALIQTVTNKAVYMTGPLMSSKESYAEKRNYLISYIEDQISNGVYKTISTEKKVIDQMTGQEKTATVVEIVQKGGVPERQEEATLREFGIRTFNFSIMSLPYDEAVEKQIKSQQQLAMDVQTAMVEAKKSEQNAITAEKNGEAAAMKAKWEQEVIKARAVTEAEQQLEVAKLNKAAAEQTKQQLILQGEGEATKRRLVMSADGALQIKVDAWLKAQEYYAAALQNYKGNWVPTVQMGDQGKNANGAMDLVNLLTATTAKQVGLDLGMQTK